MVVVQLALLYFTTTNQKREKDTLEIIRQKMLQITAKYPIDTGLHGQIHPFIQITGIDLEALVVRIGFRAVLTVPQNLHLLDISVPAGNSTDHHIQTFPFLNFPSATDGEVTRYVF